MWGDKIARAGAEPRKAHREIGLPISLPHPLNVVKQGDGILAPVSQPEEDSHSKLVDPRLGRLLRKGQPFFVILLGPCEVNLRIPFRIVGLLVEDDTVETRRNKVSVDLFAEGGDLDRYRGELRTDPTNDLFEVLGGDVRRMFTGDVEDMPETLCDQIGGLLNCFVDRQGPALDLVGKAEAAIGA